MRQVPHTTWSSLPFSLEVHSLSPLWACSEGIPAPGRVWGVFPQPCMFRGYFCSQAYPGGGIPAARHVLGGIPTARHVHSGGIPAAKHIRGAFLQLGMLGGIPAASLGNYFLRNSHHISEKLRWQLVQNLGLELQPMFS